MNQKNIETNILYTNEEWRKAMEHLEEYGYCVVPGITAEYVKKLESDFFDWFEGFDTVKRNDSKTWSGKGAPETIHGIYKHFGIGHIQAIWDARVAVAHIFEKYWNTPKLLTSFDGVCLLRPGMGFQESKADWIHTDQAPNIRVTKEVSKAFQVYNTTKQSFRCVQGILNLVDCGQDDGGLYVASGSHKHHSEFFKNTNQIGYKENWYKYLSPSKEKTESDEQYSERCKAGKDYLNRFDKVKVCANAGDMILFFSTLAHCAVPTQKWNKTHRLAFYISMLPKSLATSSELKRRRKALESLRTTSHWACLSFKMNSEFPRTYGVDDPFKIMTYPVEKSQFPILTKKMIELIGVDSKNETVIQFKHLNSIQRKRNITTEDGEYKIQKREE